MANDHGYSRRSVLKWGGAAASVVVAGAVLPNFGISAAFAADLGAGDIGVLNYAYALEQLEAAFYTMVADHPYRGASQSEVDVLAQIRDHEIAHRDFLKEALGSKAIPSLKVDFSAVNFHSRASVLKTADTFENLGVAAYNGAGHLLTPGQPPCSSRFDRLGRGAPLRGHRRTHGPWKTPKTAGAGHVDRHGLDGALSPKQVLPKVKPFVKTPVTAMSL